MGRQKTGRGETVSVYIKTPGLVALVQAQADRLGMSFSEFAQEAFLRLIEKYRPEDVHRTPLDVRNQETIEKSINDSWGLRG